MRTFETKVQYNTFETGEYTEIADRTYKDVEKLILNYKWEEQRYHLVVGLTGASVVIDNCLKLGLSYFNKFALYYWCSGKIYRCLLSNLQDALTIIQRYYSLEDILPYFKKLNGQFQAQKHFLTSFFVYKVTSRVILKYLFVPVGIPLLTMIVISALMNMPFDLSWLSSTGLFLLIFTGGNFFYFFNYYRYTKDKFIRISRGADDFEFGAFENFKNYSKLDIDYAEFYCPKGTRNILHGNTVVKLVFTDGSIINLPGLLINDVDLRSKLDHKVKCINANISWPKLLTVDGKII